MRAFVISLLAVIVAAPAVCGSKSGPPNGRPFLGVAMKVQKSPKGGTFLYVGRVGPDTSAARAGIVAGDIITMIDGKKVMVRDELDMIEIVSRLRVGQRIEIVVMRAGSPLKMPMVVDALPAEYEEAWRETFERAKRDRAPAAGQ